MRPRPRHGYLGWEGRLGFSVFFVKGPRNMRLIRSRMLSDFTALALWANIPGVALRRIGFLVARRRLLRVLTRMPDLLGPLGISLASLSLLAESLAREPDLPGPVEGGTPWTI